MNIIITSYIIIIIVKFFNVANRQVIIYSTKGVTRSIKIWYRGSSPPFPTQPPFLHKEIPIDFVASV